MKNAETIIYISVIMASIAFRAALVGFMLVTGYNLFLMLWNWTGELLINSIIPSRTQLVSIVVLGLLAPIIVSFPHIKALIKITLKGD